MKTALVTGANKGIGHEVARQLAAGGFHVFLGARNAAAGKKAASGLKGRVTFLHLDVADAASIARAAEEVAAQAGCLDVLVNNAGIIAGDDDSILSVPVSAIQETFAINTLGPLLVARAFLPLLTKSAAPRVINVSSGGGQLADGLGTWSPAYCLSKTALNAVTSLLDAALPNVVVNSVCPGWVRTDMGGAGAPRSVEKGAETIVWLAREAPQDLTGKFLRDKKIIPW